MEEIGFWKVAEQKCRKAPKQRKSGSYSFLPNDDALSKLVDYMEDEDHELTWAQYARPGMKENFQPLIPDDGDLWSNDSQAVYYRHLQSIQTLTMEEREEVRMNTISQANNDTWLEERVGRLTASVFKKSVRCRKPEYLEAYCTPSPGNNCLPLTLKSMVFASSLALQRCMCCCRGITTDTTVRPTGLHVHRDYPFLAASPDGIVCNGAEEGLLEVKCPSSKIKMTPEEACGDKEFCSMLVDNVVTLKRDHSYYYQVQGQLGVTGYSWSDFVSFTNCEDSVAKNISVERIYFDVEYWDSYLATRSVPRWKFVTGTSWESNWFQVVQTGLNWSQLGK